MAHSVADIVEKILRDCEASARPWHPEQFPRPEQLSLPQLEHLVKQLVGARLLERDPYEDGYRATTQTRLLLHDPDALKRFRHDLTEDNKPSREPARQPWELPANASPQQKAVFDTLHEPIKPYANYTLIALNAAVFLVGLMLASVAGQASNFLFGRTTETVANILNETGALTFRDLQQEGLLPWGRLLTCCFVHIGILHLGMNMYALNILGKDIEWLWGRWRFLVIYFLGGLGGSCLATYIYTGPALQWGSTRPDLLGGASGAICALLGAEAAWLFLNRSCLPKKLVSAQMRALGFNGILIVVMSLLPGVSGSAHLGGAVAGALASLFLHGQRFGKRPVQIACIAGLVLMPMLFLAPLRPGSPDSPVRVIDPRRADRDSRRLYLNTLADLLNQNPTRRNPDEVQVALRQLPEVIADLERAASQLDSSDGAPVGVPQEERIAAKVYFEMRVDLFKRMQTALEQQKAWTVMHEAEYRANEKKRPKWLDPD